MQPTKTATMRRDLVLVYLVLVRCTLGGFQVTDDEESVNATTEITTIDIDGTVSDLHQSSTESTVTPQTRTDEKSGLETKSGKDEALRTLDKVLIGLASGFFLLWIVTAVYACKLHKRLCGGKYREWEDDTEANTITEENLQKEDTIKETNSLSEMGDNVDTSNIVDNIHNPKTLEEQEQTFNFDFETNSLGLNTISRREHALDQRMQNMQLLFLALNDKPADFEVKPVANVTSEEIMQEATHDIRSKDEVLPQSSLDARLSDPVELMQKSTSEQPKTEQRQQIFTTNLLSTLLSSPTARTGGLHTNVNKAVPSTSVGEPQSLPLESSMDDLKYEEIIEAKLFPNSAPVINALNGNIYTFGDENQVITKADNVHSSIFESSKDHLEPKDTEKTSDLSGYSPRVDTSTLNKDFHIKHITNALSIGDEVSRIPSSGVSKDGSQVQEALRTNIFANSIPVSDSLDGKSRNSEESEVTVTVDMNRNPGTEVTIELEENKYNTDKPNSLTLSTYDEDKEMSTSDADAVTHF